MLHNKRGVILFVVLATVLIIVVLSGVVLSIILNQSSLTHHKVTRIKAYYAGKAMMNYTFEMLRNGTWTLPTSGFDVACHGGCIDSTGAGNVYTIIDSDITNQIQVNIYPALSSNPGGTARLEVKTIYP